MKSFGRISVAKIYNGENSISVDITANSQVFISYDRGETFTPDVIKLTPNCQGGANFKSWQYSTDNGATWKALGNNTHDCTIDSKTHVLSIKHFSDIFGVGNMVSIRANIVENESTYDVFSIAKIYDGSAMTDGYNNEVVYLYKRSTTVPTIDWTETLNYNFTIKGLTTTPNGWSTTIPDGSDPLYVTSASAFSREIVDDIEPSEWTTPILFKDKRSVTGIVNKYMVSSLSEGVKTSDSGWKDTIPEMTSNKKYLWNYKIITYDKAPTQEITNPEVIGIYGGNGSSVTYQVGDSGTNKPEGEWTETIPEVPDGKYLWTKVMMQQSDGSFTESYSVSYKGTSGSNGLNNATIYLYKRTKSTPAVPSTNVTYNFTNHTATGNDIAENKWRQTIPDGSDPIYITTATALNTEDTDIIEPSEWSEPQILSQNGSSVSILRSSVTYQVGFSGTNRPTNDAGWTETIPETEAGKYLWTRTIVEYSDGTTTESYGVSYRSLDGINGNDGYESAVVYLYKRATSVPTIDWTDTLYYNFTTSKLDKIPSGWSDIAPSGSGTLYVTTASAFSKTITDDIAYTEWTTPIAYNNTRTNTKIENFYLVSDKSSGVTTSTSGWSTTIPNMTNNKKYLWSYKKYTYDIAPLTEITTPEIISIYGGNGSSVTYQVGNSGTEKPTGAWLNTIPEVPDGKYLWTKIVILLNDGQVNESYSISYKGIDGNNGLNTATVYLYKRSASAPNKPTAAITYNFKTKTLTGNDVSSGNWSTTIPSGNTPIYIINATAANVGETDVIEATEWSSPQILSQNGTSVSVDRSVTEYQVGISGTIKPSNEAGWTTTMPEVPKGKFLWTRTTVYYTDGKSTISYAVSYQGVDGTSGSPGAEGKGYTILLSNETHTFVAANPSATTLNDGQSTTTSVKAWRNTTSVNVNVTKVNDTAVSGNATVTVNNVAFTVSGNNTANAIITIRPTAEAALTGSFKFTISIDGLSFEKVFSYASSCPGTTGKPGVDGNNGKDTYSVKLVSSSQIFKSSDGGVTFIPNTITITPIYQNCSHSKWEFSIDGGATWNYVSQNTDFEVDVENTHTLTISSSSSVFTKDVTAVSLKCTTDKENVYDVITIAKIYDVNDLVIGGRNFLSLITGDIGYCLRGYNPIKVSDGSVDSTQCLDISVDSENGWISIFGKNNNTSNNLNIFYIVNRTDINLVGGTYTLSVEWKSSDKYPLFVTTNNSSKAVSTFVLPTTDKKLTFSVDENTVVQYVGIQIPTGTVIGEDDKITFRCQLEQGTVVTDWKLDPIDLNQKYIESHSEIQSLTQTYSKFQAIFDSNNLTADSNINNTIKNLNDAINGTDSTQGILARLNDIYNDPDNALKNSTHLFEFSTWKTSKDGLEALIGKIDENTSSLNELKVKNDGLTSTVTDLTTKGVLACMDFDAEHGLTIQTPKKIGQEGGDTQARIVIDGDSVEGFSGNDERQFLIGNDGVQCKSLIVNGTTTMKNGLSFNYIKMRDYIAPMADSNGNRINGLDFTAVS